jgi:hypothetical protein
MATGAVQSMQTFYSVTTFFNNVCLAHPNIKYFTVGDVYAIDQKKQPQFPYANLLVNNVTIDSGLMNYNLTLFVMDRVKNITQNSTGGYNEFYKDWKGVDNSQDVWNTTLLTTNDILSYVYRNPQAYPYNIIGSTLCTPFEQRFDSYMWGWAAEFNMSVGNPQDMCVISISDIEAIGNEATC